MLQRRGCVVHNTVQAHLHADFEAAHRRIISRGRCCAPALRPAAEQQKFSHTHNQKSAAAHPKHWACAADMRASGDMFTSACYLQTERFIDEAAAVCTQKPQVTDEYRINATTVQSGSVR